MSESRGGGTRTGGSELRLRRRLWWALAAVTGLVVASLTGATLVSRIATQHSSGSYTSAHPLTLLRIDAGRGAVAIEAGPAGQLVLRQDLGWVTSRPRVERHWDGDTLAVTVICPGAGGPLVLLGCQADVRIQVPAGTPVDAESTSGALTVSGLSGALDLDSASGPIQGNDLRSALAQVRSASGPISLTFADAPHQVTARTSSGPIDIDVPRGDHYRATAQSDSGPASVDDGLDTPTAADTLTATSDSGPVDIAYRS
ncbi:DUF4097 family beta strand repeat-containing protein [Streptacidiphilus sp. PAMC 29251]